MTSLPPYLDPLSWNLMMSGIMLVPTRHRWLNILLKVHACLLVIACLYAIGDVKPWGIHIAQSFIRNFLNNVNASLTMIFLLMRTREITDFVAMMDKFLQEKDKRDVYRFGLKVFFFKIFSLLMFRFSSLKIIMLKDLLPWNDSKFYIDYLRIYISLHSWSLIVYSIFLVLLKVIQRTERNRLVRMTKELTAWTDPTSVYQTLKEIVKIKIEFCRIMSFLPCLYFLYIFYLSVFSIVREQNSWTHPSKDKLGEQIFSKLNLCHFILVLLQMIYLSFFVTNLGKESIELTETLESTIILTPGIDRKEWFFVFDQIKESKSYEYQAWDFFSINKQILISFVASLVSFTVLFVQLLSFKQDD